jgi:hypothetical protein
MLDLFKKVRKFYNKDSSIAVKMLFSGCAHAMGVTIVIQKSENKNKKS